MADETPTRKRKRSLEDELRDTPAGPSSPNAAWDEAERRTAAAEKLRSDVAAMPKLPVGRAPAAPARTLGKPITHGSAPAAPAAAMARADVALGGAPAARTVQQLATDLQQTQRNHPAALGPGLRPNLAGLDPVSAEVKDFINKPGRNTLTPEAFFAQQERDQAESTLHDMNPALGDPEAVARAHSARARKAGLDAATAGQDLGANREKYLANRGATPDGRQGLVMARGMTRGMEKLMAMNPRVAGALGMGGGAGATGASATQRFDPFSSGVAGFMLGGPTLGTSWAEGAQRANESGTADQHFRDSLNQQAAQSLAALAQQQMHHTETMQQGKERLAAIAGQNAPPTTGEMLGKLANTEVQAGVVNGPYSRAYQNFVRMTGAGQPAGAGSPTAVSSLPNTAPDIFETGRSPAEAAKRGILSPEYHKSLEKYVTDTLDLPGIDSVRSHAGWPFLHYFGIGPTMNDRHNFIRQKLAPVIAGQLGLAPDSPQVQSLLSQFIEHFDNRTSPAPLAPPEMVGI